MYDKKYYEEHKEKIHASQKKYREKHKEEEKVRGKKYREENKEKIRDRHRKWRVANPGHLYGISLDEFNLKIKEQNSLCAICLKLMAPPFVDHNHITGENRDMLCRYCNTGLGMFFESIETLQSAVEYLKKHSVVV
jgi:hypothetical protein